METLKKSLTNPAFTKGYLMLAGSLMPATIAVLVASFIGKNKTKGLVDFKTRNNLIIFFAAAAVGGIITSMMIKANSVDVPAPPAASTTITEEITDEV